MGSEQAAIAARLARVHRLAVAAELQQLDRAAGGASPGGDRARTVVSADAPAREEHLSARQAAYLLAEVSQQRKTIEELRVAIGALQQRLRDLARRVR